MTNLEKWQYFQQLGSSVSFSEKIVFLLLQDIAQRKGLEDVWQQLSPLRQEHLITVMLFEVEQNRKSGVNMACSFADTLFQEPAYLKVWIQISESQRDIIIDRWLEIAKQC